MELTASQLAALVSGTVEGDPEVKVSDFAKIEEGHPGALSFLANPKYTHYIYNTESSVVLVRKDFEPEQPVRATLIRVDDPYATIAHLLKMVQDMAAASKPHGIEEPSHIDKSARMGEEPYIGAFAYIAADCQIGNRVSIYPQVYIGRGCEIGDDTVIYPGVKIYPGCCIGKNCIIHAGAVIGADGFGFAPVEGGYEKIPQTGNVVIEDDVEIGANTTIDRAMMGSTRICRGTKLDNLIQIAHNCQVGNDTVMAAQVGMAGSSKIGSHCMVGGQAGFAGHISIADYTHVGAQSGVTHDTERGAQILGSPAVDGHDFARSLVYVKRIPKIIDELNALKKKN